MNYKILNYLKQSQRWLKIYMNIKWIQIQVNKYRIWKYSYTSENPKIKLHITTKYTATTTTTNQQITLYNEEKWFLIKERKHNQTQTSENRVLVGKITTQSLTKVRMRSPKAESEGQGKEYKPLTSYTSTHIWQFKLWPLSILARFTCKHSCSNLLKIFSTILHRASS